MLHFLPVVFQENYVGRLKLKNRIIFAQIINIIVTPFPTPITHPKRLKTYLVLISFLKACSNLNLYTRIFSIELDSLDKFFHLTSHTKILFFFSNS